MNRNRSQLNAANLTIGFLQETSRRIIDLFRSKKYDALLDLHKALFKSGAAGTGPRPPRKVFLELIKLYHPDTFLFHQSNLAKKVNPGPEYGRDFYEAFFSTGRTAPASRRHFDHGPYRETYVYEEAARADEYFEDDYLSEAESGSDVISILSALFLGNSTGRMLEPIDLEQLEESIDLSHHDLDDLDGLQYCLNISGLNLSDNKIDNLYELSALAYLEELDLTNNSITSVAPLASLQQLKTLYLGNNGIEDISPLLECGRLEFVSVVNNPLAGLQDIKALSERGVVVVYF